MVDETVVTDSEEESPKFDFSTILPKETTSLDELLTVHQRVGWRPKIAHLPDAIVDGQLLLKEGDKVLIEYTDSPWRDTTLWVIAAIEPPGIVEQGHVRLWDPNKNQYGSTNYHTAAAQGLVLKVPDVKQRWVPGENETLMEKVRRERQERRGLRQKEPRPVAQAPVDVDGNPIKKKRGRPKGSKNKATLERESAERRAQEQAHA